MLVTDKNESILAPTDFYQQLIQELDQIGWQKISNIKADLSMLCITVSDSKLRAHTCDVHVQTSSYPDVAPKCMASLPVAFDIKWNNNNQTTSCLHYIVEQLEDAIARYQLFWDEMDDLDANSLILEPEKPSRSITMRRIGIGSHSSMQIDIDPLNPRNAPECRFLGADAVIGPMRDKLNRYLPNWNINHSIRENLEAAFKMQLPKPVQQHMEDADEFSVECGICYMYRLNHLVPDKVCNNTKCCKPFHSTCLSAW